MKLPNLEKATVPPPKITDYLLSATHRDGRGKAEFFTRYGFSLTEWETLANALLHHAADHDVTRVESSTFGKRYVIDGIMNTPDGRVANIRTVWFIETGEDTPRFATAYPLSRSKR